MDALRLDSETALRKVYIEPSKPVRDKALPSLDKHSRRFIELSPFLCIGSSRADGLADVSPRGGEPGFVHAIDDVTLAFPDRPGNNRLDTLTNLVHNPAVGLLFFLPGVQEMLRVNGEAAISTAPELMARFVHDGKLPRSVIIITTHEVYFHCSKALRRSELWNPERQIRREEFPTLGQIARDQAKLPIPARLIDLALDRDARKNLY